MEAAVKFSPGKELTMNKRKITKSSKSADPHAIVFGFDRKTDEQSLQLFLQRFTDKKLLEVLLPRLQDKDILATVDFLTTIMQKNLSEKEYHSLFLAEEGQKTRAKWRGKR
jgi:hypothetical protein